MTETQSQAPRYASSYLTDRQSLSAKTVSRHTPLAIHADLEIGILQRSDTFEGREPAALICGHDLGLTVTGHGVFHGVGARHHAKAGLFGLKKEIPTHLSQLNLIA
ncbi:MAG: hypothetical protein AAF317_00515 [Pseudomonadota bacterium]